MNISKLHTDYMLVEPKIVFGAKIIYVLILFMVDEVFEYFWRACWASFLKLKED